MRIKRIIKTLSAHSYGQLITIFLTLIIPSIIINRWGAEFFGKWITVFAITQFFSLSDLGISIGLGNQLCLNSNDSKEKAYALINKTCKFILLNIFFCILIILIVSILLNLYLEKILINNINEMTIIFFFSSLISVFQPYQNILAAYYRYNNKIELGIFLTNTIRLLEGLVFIVLTYEDIDLEYILVSLLIIRLIITIYIYLRIKIKCKNKTIEVEKFKEMKHAGYGFATIQISQQINLQGPVILISFIVGANEAGLLSVSRTISRLPVQPLIIFLNSINHDITELYKNKKFIEIKNNIRKLALIFTTISVIIATISILATELIENYWLHNKLSLDTWLLLPLVLATCFVIRGFVYGLTLNSTNNTKTQSKINLLIDTLSLLLMFISACLFGNLYLSIMPLLLGEILKEYYIKKLYLNLIDKCIKI
jgi:hypothetical protein